jgi:hypothetical protein
MKKDRPVADQNEPKSAGEDKGIRLGSLFGPTYLDSYSEAWKVLLPNAKRLALPILYLQRHTFELLLKDLLLGALDARAELHAMDDLFGTADGPGPTEPDDFQKAHTTHSFAELFPCLERNLAALRRPSLPQAFIRARTLFTNVDEDRPDKLRYATTFSRQRRTTQRSFPTGHGGGPTKYAPCAQVASLLDEILQAREEALSAFVKHTEPPTSEIAQFFTAAWECYQESEGEVLHRLAPLTAGTRDGGIVWRTTASARLNIHEHPDLKSVASVVAEVCLESPFRGRVLTILILKDSSGQIGWGHSQFFLAARRPNGTLTAGTWVSECQSNLIYEIQEAFKRSNEPAASPGAE